jgi:hypothetical protein
MRKNRATNRSHYMRHILPIHHRRRSLSLHLSAKPQRNPSTSTSILPFQRDVQNISTATKFPRPPNPPIRETAPWRRWRADIISHNAKRAATGGIWEPSGGPWRGLASHIFADEPGEPSVDDGIADVEGFFAVGIHAVLGGSRDGMDAVFVWFLGWAGGLTLEIRGGRLGGWWLEDGIDDADGDVGVGGVGGRCGGGEV